MSHDERPTVDLRVGEGGVVLDRREAAERTASDPPAIARGEAIGRYLTIERIGAGGMGVVYAAYDPELNRRVAIKVLRVASGGESITAGRARLLREAQSLARLSHPNVIPVHDVGSHEDGVFMAMELVEGVTLGAWRKQAERGWREVRDLYVLAGRGLAAAHEANLVHRDFKPENVLVGKDGRVRVTDFGLAREAADEEPLPSPNPSDVTPASGLSSPSSPITVAGQVMGTPPYMAPELFDGKPADPRSDQWSYCAALYEALYGVHPFARPTMDEQRRALRAGEINAAPPGTRVPASLRRIVVRGLARDPAERWPAMAALLAALGREGQLRRRETVAVLVAALAVVGAVAGVAIDRRAPAASVCAGTGALLDGIWDDAARAGVTRAFAATGVPYAGEAAAAVRGLLDGYAGGWVAMHDEACRATHVLGAQPAPVLEARMLCLNRRLGELDRLVRLLGHADARLVELSAQAALRLPPVADCATAEVGLPDPALQAQMAAVRGRIDDAEALHSAGRYAEARAVAAQVALEARALVELGAQAGAQQVAGEALVTLGTLEGVLGEPRRAQVTLADAAVAALSGGDERTACDAWTRLTEVTGNDLAAFDEALRWGRMAQAVAVRLEPRGRRAASVARTLATVYKDQGRYDDAERAYRQALALREELHGPDHPAVATAHKDLGVMARLRGDLALAATELHRGLEIERRTLGDNHPQLQSTYTNLATVAIDAARFEDALDLAGKALALRLRAFGPDHPEVAHALTLLAIAHEGLGAYPEALDRYRRALAITERRGGNEGELDLADVLSAIGGTYHKTGDFTAALEANRRAAGIRERLLGADHPTFAINLVNQGVELKSLGRYAEAERQHRRALAIFEAKLGPEHPHVGIVLDNQAEALRLMGDAAGALVVYRRSLAVLEKSLGKDHPIVADALTGLGRSALALGQVEEALPALERALAMREAGPDDTNLAETRFALAQALARRGSAEAARGRALAERALAVYVAGGPGYARPRREVESWLGAHR